MSGDLGFSRLQASLGQMTQYLTVTAANFNFDFTLVKVEAPPEYRDIATVLSPARAIISVRASGRWVAGVDILAALSLGQLHPRVIQIERRCQRTSDTDEVNSNLLPIETWDQALDIPDGSVVV
ncbi:hypothetical protein F4825DRAFT_452191 [Nemania diffusa]|nr:hypothetical protein F4825DRAFT_452191 [Nemania diffusa]